jgi:hypothetical protein
MPLDKHNQGLVLDGKRELDLLRPCLLLWYFHSQEMWRCAKILSNPLKYSFLKILYHDGEFLI